MAGALGLLTGLGLGVAGGYAKEKVAKKHESEAVWHDFMTNAINQHPEVAGTEEGQKAIKGLYGEHAPIVSGFLQTAAKMRQQAAQDYSQNVIGGGGQQPAQPETPQSLRDLASRAEQHLADPQYANVYSKEQVAAGTSHIKDLRERADKLDAQAAALKLKQTETPYQQQEAKDRQTSLSLAARRENREEKTAADVEEGRKFNQSIARARLDLARSARGGKGITPAKLASDYQRFKGQFAQFDTSDPERAVAIEDAWNQHLDLLKQTGTDPKLLEPFYTGGATEVSTGGISGMLGSKKAVEKPKAAEMKTDDPLIGTATSAKDGRYPKEGKIYTIKGGKVIGYESSGG